MTLKDIRQIIRKNDQQDKIGVDSVGNKHIVVNNFGAGRDETTYVCHTLEDAASIVKMIIFGVPIIVEMP